MFNDGLDRFRSGVRDLSGRLMEHASAAWAAAGHAASISERERREKLETRTEIKRLARAAARLERHVRRYGSWFPSDGPP